MASDPRHPIDPPQPLTHRRVRARGLEHHLLEWLPSRAPHRSAATVVLLHGYLDAAGSWDLVAPALVEAGFHVLAPDMRGHGDGPRTPPGSYYHFAEYVADLAELLDALELRGDLLLVGHSMGGTIATLYAGTFPERVTKLALLEGVGPEGSSHEAAPERMRLWIETVRARGARGPEAPLTPDEALERLARNQPGVPRDILRTRLAHLARPSDERPGHVTWKVDPLHKTRSPTPFFAETYRAFARRVTCPVLFVSGGVNGYHPADEEARLQAFSRMHRVELPGAGHMMHWTAPRELAAQLVTFWAT